MPTHQHPTQPVADCGALVAELVGALLDLDALSLLDVDRLAAIVTAAESGLGAVGDFAAAARNAWDMIREPSDADLDGLSDAIDWGFGDDIDALDTDWVPLASVPDLPGGKYGNDADEMALSIAMAEARRLPGTLAA